MTLRPAGKMYHNHPMNMLKIEYVAVVNVKKQKNNIYMYILCFDLIISGSSRFSS